MTESLLARLNDEEARKADRSRDILLFTKEGYSIFVGRNSEANDALLSQHNHPRCIWLHIEEGGGSHVVLCVEGLKDPGDAILRFAASLAKRFSKSESTKIRYSFLENVFKPVGCGIGIWKSRMPTILDLKE